MRFVVSSMQKTTSFVHVAAMPFHNNFALAKFYASMQEPSSLLLRNVDGIVCVYAFCVEESPSMRVQFSLGCILYAEKSKDPLTSLTRQEPADRCWFVPPRDGVPSNWKQLHTFSMMCNETNANASAIFNCSIHSSLTQNKTHLMAIKNDLSKATATRTHTHASN